MSVLESSLELASLGGRFFRCTPNEKTPLVSGYYNEATSDPDKLIKLFKGTNYNSGFLCGEFETGHYFVGLDIDVKNGKNGFKTVE